MLKIGPYTLQSPVLLAPMAGITDAPLRQICQEYGAGLTTSEMLTANEDCWDSQKSRLRRIHTSHLQIPNSIQIVGSDPKLLAHAALKNSQQGADIIDINMGCPAKKVCKKLAGSALLKDEALVANILSSVVNAVDVPVTLKIRTGWDKQQRNARTIAKIAEECGIQALTIHGRTRACRFSGCAEYDTIADVKQNVSIPVIANGDIDSIEKALAVAKYTKADGLMIGRAVQGQPWFIQQLVQNLQGQIATEISQTEKLECILNHITALHQFYGDFLSVRIARKHMASYLDKLHFKPSYKQLFNTLGSITEQINFINHLPNDVIKGKAA